MFVSIPVLLGIAIVAVLVGIWATAKLKRQIKHEKLASFGFALGTIIQGVQIEDGVSRVAWMATNLSSVRGDIPKNSFEPLIRAGVLLYVIRIVSHNTQGTSSAALADMGGEYIRHLGVSVAGSGQPKAIELATLAISVCENSPATLSTDDLCGALCNDVRFADGQSYFSVQDFLAAQLIIERNLLKLYGDNMNIRLFSEL